MEGGAGGKGTGESAWGPEDLRGISQVLPLSCSRNNTVALRVLLKSQHVRLQTGCRARWTGAGQSWVVRGWFEAHSWGEAGAVQTAVAP